MANDKESKVDVIINNRAAISSLKEVETAMRTLRAAYRETTDPSRIKDISEKYQELDKRAKDMNNTLKGTGGLWNTIGKEVKAFGLVAASYLGFQFLSSQISNIIQKNAQLSDSLADIQQTTGMTGAEVLALNKELSKVDTRTATKELREMAIAAGQLGVAKEDIKDFVIATDKLNVALGREFGGNAEQLTTELGKMRNVLTDIKSDKIDEDMLHLGNALLELGQSGIATAPVVSDFANRIAGVGIPLGLTSAQVLGLSATLQELNVSTERGGTAITKILQKMASDTDSFAKIAGMSITEYKNLLNTDLNAAFIKVVEGSQKAGTSATALAAVMKDAELQGSGASEVFLKLAKNMPLLAEKTKLAGDSLKSTDMIMDSFNRKNNTLGADLEKLSKRIGSWFVNSAFTEFLSKGVHAMADMSKESDKLIDSFKQSKRESERLTNSVEPLLDKYERLKSMSKLSADQQEELKQVINEVSKAIPLAVSSFDKYGNAIDISTDAARKFIEAQQKLTEFKNKDALSAATQSLIQLQKEQSATQASLNKTLKAYRDGTKIEITNAKGDFVGYREVTVEEVNKMQQALINYQDQIEKTGLQIRELMGISLVAPATSGTGAKSQTPEEKAANELADKNKEEAEKKYIENTRKLLDELQNLKIEFIEDELQRERSKLEHEWKLSKEDVEKTVADKKVKNDLLLQLDLKYIKDREELDANYVKKAAEDDLKNNLEAIDKWHAQEKLAISKQRADGEISEKEFNDRLTKLDRQRLEYRIINLKDYGKDTVAEEQQLADIIIGINNKKNDEITKSDKERFKSLDDRIKNMSRGELKKELQDEQAALLEYSLFGISVTGETADQMVEHIGKLIDAIDGKFSEFWQNFGASVQQYGNVIAQGWSTILRMQNNDSQAWLQKQKAIYDKDRIYFKEQLRLKLLTQDQYDKKIAELEEKQAKDQRKAAHDEAIRNKRMGIFNAIINTAQAVSGALAAMPWGPQNFVMATAMGVLGGLEVAEIANAPVPELGRGKKFTGIGKHPYSTRRVRESNGDEFVVEDGEVLLSADTVEKNPIVDDLLEASLYNNGELRIPNLEQEFPQLNTSRISETSRLLKSDPFLPLNGKQAVNDPMAQASSRTAQPRDPAIAELKDVLLNLHEVLDDLRTNGIDAEAKIDPFKWKRDMKQYETIISGKK